MDLAHPLRVTLGQVVVDRDDVDALAFQSVQIGRESRDQGLAFTGLHFGDAALVQDDAADQLYAVVFQTDGALRAFAHESEGFDQDVVQGLAVCQAFLELTGLRLHLFLSHGLHRRTQGFDFIHQRFDAL